MPRLGHGYILAAGDDGGALRVVVLVQEEASMTVAHKRVGSWRPRNLDALIPGDRGRALQLADKTTYSVVYIWGLVLRAPTQFMMVVGNP